MLVNNIIGGYVTQDGRGNLDRLITFTLLD